MTRAILRFGFILAYAVCMRAEPLDTVLARMDRAAKEFKSMTAKVNQTDYTAVIDESRKQSGEIRLKRGKGGVVMLVDFEQPEHNVFHLAGHQAEIYYPKANTVQVYDIGKHVSGSIEQFLLAGFGTPLAELQKAYTIIDGGSATLGSVQTTRIELTPKGSDVRQYVSKIELWIPDGQSSPIQEKVTKPSGKDYTQFDYSDLKINPNPPPPDSAFELTVPPGTKKIYPQK